MNIRKLSDGWAGPRPRFLTIEAANAYMDCVRNRKPVPDGIMVMPHVAIDGAIVPNKEYADAPYEAQLVFA